MSQVLATEITEESVHSFLLCKKCYKLFDEVDELEQRLLDIKVELVSNYKKSIDKSKDTEHNNEDEVEDKTETEENAPNKDKGLIPKKILDIPSSDDDDNTQVSPIFKSAHVEIVRECWPCLFSFFLYQCYQLSTYKYIE